jgi:hypothetical protein
LLGKKISATVKQIQGKQTEKLSIGGCTKEEIVQNIIFSAIANENILFVPQSKKNKFIDFIYRKGTTYNMFQATISSRHSCNVAHLYAIVKSIWNNRHGLNDRRNRRAHTNSLPSFNVYYMVPTFSFGKFNTSPVNPKDKTPEEFGISENQNVLYEKWNDLVSFKVLEVEKPK